MALHRPTGRTRRAVDPSASSNRDRTRGLMSLYIVHIRKCQWSTAGMTNSAAAVASLLLLLLPPLLPLLLLLLPS